MELIDNPSLTAEWLQITDGSGHSTVQVKKGPVYITSSEGKPARDAVVYIIRDGFFDINPPMQGWIRSGRDSLAHITYSR